MTDAVALVTARAARGLDEDQAPLEQALRAAGARVAVADWDDPEVDWASFDLVLLRSSWDYTDRLDEFLAWVRRAGARTVLANPQPVLSWNTDKHYLADLCAAGVPVVPTQFIEPGEDAAGAIRAFLSARKQPELVIKPAVGAGSRNVQRHRRDCREAAIAHARELLGNGRSVLLQPYLRRVDDYGETALVFFAGQFSHAVRKGPMLSRPADPGGRNTPCLAGHCLFLPEQITPRRASADELAVASAALGAVPFGNLLYARVDLVRDDEGSPAVLELELTEPSLFLSLAPGAADRFAGAALRHLSCAPAT